MLADIPEVIILANLVGHLRGRLGAAGREEAGYSTEAVIVTALLVALGITAVTIIAAKVISAARGVKTR
jgi:hypothetical protein